MSTIGYLPTSLCEWLESATDKDMYRAAEAVVDAAIHCHQYKNNSPVTSYMRSLLIQAVLDDPSVTEFLFSGGSFGIH